jgi:hypothetical protein
MGANTRDATSLQKAATTDWGPGKIGFVNIRVDMAKVKALGNAIDGSNSDVVQLWNIPPGTHIFSVRIVLLKKEGAASTITIGDGASAAGFLAAFSLNGTVRGVTVDGTGTAMTLTTDAFGATCGKTYYVADTLDGTFATDTDIAVAQFDLQILCAMFEFPTSPPGDWT